MRSSEGQGLWASEYLCQGSQLRPAELLDDDDDVVSLIGFKV